MNPRQHKPEVTHIVATRVVHLREIDIEPDIIGKEGSSRREQTVRQVPRQLRVNLAIQRDTGCIPRRLGARTARESDGGDPRVMSSVGRCPDRSRDRSRHAEVCADVGAGDGEVGRPIEELGGQGVDSVFDGGDGERVDPV